jgi:ribosomal protein S18 acetylase RimI-like enzyme
MDIGCICDTEVDATVDLWRRCGLAEPGQDALEDLQRARASNNAIVLVGRVEGKVCATAMVGFDGHRAWTYYVAVDPDLQRAGLGRMMMKAAESWARERGAPKLLLMVSDDNAKVLGFYTALGFQVRPFKPLAIPL